MRFIVLSNNQPVPSGAKSTCYLWEDNWNDWFEFQTLYYLFYSDSKGVVSSIGNVKIGQFGMLSGQSRPNLPRQFSALDLQFFSVGQDVTYYTNLRTLGPAVSRKILDALNDFALKPEVFEQAQREKVTNTSLLRSVTGTSINGQFRRIIEGGAPLTEYNFRFTAPDSNNGQQKVVLEFKVEPESTPPTNIHVLIGSNGVGKSYLLHAMSRAAVYSDQMSPLLGYFEATDDHQLFETTSRFAGVLSISFSAFDDFPSLNEIYVDRQTTRYRHVGLRRPSSPESNSQGTTKSPKDHVTDFKEVLGICNQGDRLRLWKRALETLEADPLFAEYSISEILSVGQSDFYSGAEGFFAALSSGHKIVLLTVSHLIANVEEKTLVLMDEPEAHLHPPLLAALIRAVSDLLIDRNGVAIIATHSPVVLQEVPSHCVWRIVRHGAEARAGRLQTETFGESVGVLTRAVFGLEVTRSGFHKMLIDASRRGDSVDTVMMRFGWAVGSEGRALLASHIALGVDEE